MVIYKYRYCQVANSIRVNNNKQTITVSDRCLVGTKFTSKSIKIVNSEIYASRHVFTPTSSLYKTTRRWRGGKIKT